MSPDTVKHSKPAPDEFTATERIKLVEFRKRVEKVYPQPDCQLIIWLRARGLNVAKAEQMLRRHLIWRKVNQIDALLEWRSTKVYAPSLYIGNDFGGSPVLLVPFGHYEIKGPLEAGDILSILRFVGHTLEMNSKLMKSQGVNNAVLIVDCDGFRYHQFTSRLAIQLVMELGRLVEANYPEALKHGIVINAPRLFNALFAILKTVLAARTISKIEIFRSDKSKWFKALTKLMSKDIIPPYWGGARSGSDEFCSDEWYQEPLPHYFMRRVDSVYDEYGQEWISIKIGAGECFTFEYPIREEQLGRNPVLTWAFYTDGYDIAFGSKFEDEQLIGLKRINSHKAKQFGSQTLDKAGKYVLTFDNKYSRSRSKILHYVINLVSDEDDDDVGAAEHLIMVSTPNGSTRALNVIGSGCSSYGMSMLNLPVPTIINGRNSSIISTASSIGSATYSVGTPEHEKIFLNADED